MTTRQNNIMKAAYRDGYRVEEKGLKGSDERLAHRSFWYSDLHHNERNDGTFDDCFESFLDGRQDAHDDANNNDYNGAS